MLRSDRGEIHVKEVKMGLLQTHEHESEGVLLFLEEVLLHGLIDTLKLVPFLFLTYLLMEFIEHRAGDRAEHFMERASRFAPFVGGALGAVPQCGFSAAASISTPQELSASAR